MNVMNYKQENTSPLVSILSMVTLGTRVTVEVDNYATVCLGCVETAKSVLALCRKCYRIYGHHPKVYEIAPIPDYDGNRLLLRCV
jgi:hypothetical protein